jgi:hypothetical protein
MMNQYASNPQDDFSADPAVVQMAQVVALAQYAKELISKNRVDSEQQARFFTSEAKGHPLVTSDDGHDTFRRLLALDSVTEAELQRLLTDSFKELERTQKRKAVNEFFAGVLEGMTFGVWKPEA